MLKSEDYENLDKELKDLKIFKSPKVYEEEEHEEEKRANSDIYL